MAIASAKVADTIYRQVFGSHRFKVLKDQGARPQRLLWASTSTKNPAYSDVKYVEPLIGPETINTLPLETLNAYRDHGKPASRLSEGADQAAAVLQRLPELGIDLNQVTQQLEDEGVEKFNSALRQTNAQPGGQAPAGSGRRLRRRNFQGEVCSAPEQLRPHGRRRLRLGGEVTITTMFLDIGGVLLTNGWDRSMRRRAAEIFQLDYEEMNERHHLTFDTYEQGKLSLDEYLARVVFYEDRSFTREDFQDFMFSQSQQPPEMAQTEGLIKGLKAKYNLKVAVVSN